MKEYTKEQMKAWGYYNTMIGACAITLVHVLALILGIVSLDLFSNAVLLLILGAVAFIYHQQYRNTKETEE